MPKTVYQCLLCKKVYADIQTASSCESSHDDIRDYTVVDRRWELEGFNSCFPDKIQIKNHNRHKVWYRLIPEYLHVDYEVVADKVSKLLTKGGS